MSPSGDRDLDTFLLGELERRSNLFLEFGSHHTKDSSSRQAAGIVDRSVPVLHRHRSILDGHNAGFRNGQAVGSQQAVFVPIHFRSSCIDLHLPDHCDAEQIKSKHTERRSLHKEAA